MKTLFLVIGAALSLTGCDAATGYMAKLAVANEPTIVIAPGYKIAIDGKPVSIFGFDECPKSDPTMVKLFGETPTAGGHNCIVLDKNRREVPVLVALPTGRVTEKWTIVRETGKAGERPYSHTGLRRPDGTPVVPAA